MSADEPTRQEGFPGQRLVVVPPTLVKRALKAPITRDLCVTHIGSFIAASSHSVRRPKGAAQHVMIGCVAGKGSGSVEGSEWRLGPGELVFLPPGREHHYRSDGERPWTIFWVHFQGKRARDYLGMLGMAGEVGVVKLDAPRSVTEAFEDTIRHTVHGFGELAMLGMSTAFARLLGLVRVHQSRLGGRTRGGELRVQNALSKMRGDLAHAWSVEELAALAGMSVPHFTDRCRQQSGMPPLALLIRLRLQKAMELLHSGTCNVSEAAQAVGYSDPFYFSRLFKRHMGVAPSACRAGE